LNKPIIGQAVHYVSHGTPVREDGTQAYTSQCRAATVTEVEAGTTPQMVGLHVVNPTGQFFHSLADGGCVQDEADRFGGTWHWADHA